MGAILDFIGGVGNVLDTPGSMVRDTLGGQNPFDQLAAPWSGKKRLSGRDLLRKYGLASEEDTGMNAAGGVAAEMALDPLSWLGIGALTKGLRGASKAASAGRAVSPIKQAMTRGARPAVAMSVASPVAGAYLLGDNEEGSTLKNVLGTGLMAAPLVLGMAGGAKKLTGWKRQVAEFNAAEDAKIMQRIQAAQTPEEAERLKGLLSTAGKQNATTPSTAPIARHESDFLEQMGFWSADKKSAALKAIRDAGIDDATSPDAEAILRQIAPKAGSIDLKPDMTPEDELTQRIAAARKTAASTRKYLGGALGGAVLARALSQRNQEA